jgi:hypothetical protein
LLNGFDDWRLPNKEELNWLYQNKKEVGGFNEYYYWSSSEVDDTKKWYQEFRNGKQYISGNKVDAFNVRAVRSF